MHPAIERRAPDESAAGDSQTTLNTSDARLLSAVLSVPRRPEPFARLVEGASWWVLTKVLLVTSAALARVRLAAPDVPLNPALYAAMFTAFAGVGAWLVIGGARDRGARSLGAFFLLVGLACARGASRALGHRIGGLAGAALLTDLDPLMPLCLWVFAREFPARIGNRAERRLVNAASLLSLGAAFVLLAISFVSAGGVQMPAMLLVGRPDLYWGIIFGLTALAFPYLLSRCLRTSQGDRARASWMLLGLVVAFAPVVFEVMGELLIPSYEAWTLNTTYRSVLGTALMGFLLTLPFTTTYAVVSRQTLDVRIVIRRALQCSLAKYACAVACLLPLAWIAWLAYSHRAMSIQALAEQKSAEFGGVAAAVGVIGLFFYPRLLGAVDRSFFGPRYDARQVNADFRAAIWRTANANASAALLVRTARSVLSATSASVLVRGDGGGAYVDPFAHAAIPVDSALIDLLARERRGDVPVTDRLLATIGAEDAQWITHTTTVLLVPLRASTNELVGILGLGPRCDERPYFAEDRHLLVDMAMHASPILERQLAHASRRARHSRGSDDVLAAECPACGIVAARTAAACPRCRTPMERSNLPPVVNGKYRVLSRIARGGMGVVYRAEDEILGRTVALKTMPYLSGLAELRSTSEGRAMAGAVHPNLATVFGFEISVDRPVLVLEFLDGGTLKDRLAAGPLTIDSALDIVVGVCDGLRWLHRQDINHGDIKPSNIGFAASGAPKLLDFGLAEAVTRATAAGQSQAFRGTLQYSCPYRPGTSFASNDLWALSAVLFECATGRRLFDVLESTPPDQGIDATRLCPRLSVELALVLNRSLSPDPAARPQSVDEFRLWLERARPI